MTTFREFIANAIDESQIDALYNKAHIAVELARAYAPELLQNIAVIGNLASGAYGIYNSGENKKLLPKSVEQALIYYGRVNQKNINNIPKKVIRQYYPQVPDNEIKSSDTIHVNIRRIISELPNDLDRIVEIASTIVHEATHEWERENLGSTSEAGPVKREREFKNWVYNGNGKSVLNGLLRRHQQLGTSSLGSPNQKQPQFPSQSIPTQLGQGADAPL